jgi:parallel beta-helix repeat protein
VPTGFANLQLAIDSASPLDTVYVEAGTYTGAGNKNIDFRGKDVVVWGIEGAEATIIDCEGSELENARGFIFENAEPRTAVVSGLTIRNGYRSGVLYPGGYGGAMLISGSDARPTIKNCIFEDNYAGIGGGVAAGDGSAPTIADCRFLNNDGDSGGGGAFVSGSALLVECGFTGNRASHGVGGGVRCSSEYAPRLRDCVFRENRARAGGGLASGIATPTVAQCTFIGNQVTSSRGGGVYVEDGADIVLSKCVFIGNDAALRYGGAAACTGVTTMTLDGCTLYQNVAPFGSGLHVSDSGTLQVDNTIIAFGLEGAAVVCDGAAAVNLSCCDLYGNQGGDWVDCVAGQGGGNGNMSSDPLFCNVGEENLYLAEMSPCAPERAGDCGLIGRFAVDCTTAVEEATWGGIKALYGR